MHENRKHPRKAIVHPVAFQVGDDAPWVQATCRDMSLGGSFIETPTPAPFGATIRIVLALPGLPKQTVVSSIVRWTNPTGMGVQFGVMGARDTNALIELLQL